MSILNTLLADYRAECQALDAIAATLRPAQWSAATPAEGWDVRDQFWHLAWYEGAALRAVTTPAEFAAEGKRAAADMARYDGAVVAQGRTLAPTTVRARWLEHSERFRTAAAAAEAGRVDWFVTTMSVTSLVSARLMETWAHGQDVRDTFGLPPEQTDRLRHVAHIATGALPYAFRVRGRKPPEDPVRVELELPSGAALHLGPADAADVVSGPALDFCLVTTQRRAIEDVRLTITGPTAASWMAIAQAFAGPPGLGRAAGQFPRPEPCGRQP